MTIARVGLAVLALLHLWFLVLEMILWRTPFGLRTFGLSAEDAQKTAPLAANQGLYNGFLAAGMIWAAVSGGRELGLFFAGCALVAGLFGGATASRKILFVQALPAALALACLVARA